MLSITKTKSAASCQNFLTRSCGFCVSLLRVLYGFDKFIIDGPEDVKNEYEAMLVSKERSIPKHYFFSIPLPPFIFPTTSLANYVAVIICYSLFDLDQFFLKERIVKIKQLIRMILSIDPFLYDHASQQLVQSTYFESYHNLLLIPLHRRKVKSFP